MQDLADLTFINEESGKPQSIKIRPEQLATIWTEYYDTYVEVLIVLSTGHEYTFAAKDNNNEGRAGDFTSSLQDFYDDLETESE